MPEVRSYLGHIITKKWAGFLVACHVSGDGESFLDCSGSFLDDSKPFLDGGNPFLSGRQPF